MSPDEHRRAPALWLVVAAIVATTVIALVVGAREASGALAVTLIGAAVARVIGRGRRPVGIAVRSVWVDTMILAVLATAISILGLSPGV